MVYRLPYFVSSKEWTRGKYLGAGSYGSVFFALHKNPSVPLLAVKSCPFKNSDSLQKEYRILRELSGCPEIIQPYAYSISHDQKCNGIYNLLLEYASGGSLCDLMMSYGGKIPESDVRQYARMLLKGLSWIHENGYVHCDLKPANILVFPSQNQGLSQLKIADFGLAKEPDEDESKEKLLKLPHFRGTPLYMSPESTFMGEIMSALDIWSLGCVVVEMITGQPVWDNLSLQQLLVNLYFVSSEFPPIPEYISEKGKDFLKMCFKTNPEERWTANMLLNHPYIVDEQLTLPEEIFDDDFFQSIVNFSLSSPDSSPLYPLKDKEKKMIMVGQRLETKCY